MFYREVKYFITNIVFFVKWDRTSCTVECVVIINLSDFPETRPSVFYISSVFLFLKIPFWHLGFLCLSNNGHLPFMQESHIPHQNPSLMSAEWWLLNCYDTRRQMSVSSFMSWLGAGQAGCFALCGFLETRLTINRICWQFSVMCSWLGVGREVRSRSRVDFHEDFFNIPSYFDSVDFRLASK